ncbi:glucose/arabinose dehydrogenase [Algoriphagus sp. 4150]|uniref:PQQ-dependent sugar dehydrogenase n=1 Tax=Algoriphagus sp. 4150 TaxID=2817756 RepID=UPI002857FEDB|nr:PQQ-dependent sugar dehydrogenase [Algoriphagus sp. 4150]MDR7129696.1 glucose/arabinose dehydrogenase [Algoriphagus sp. 4150]
MMISKGKHLGALLILVSILGCEQQNRYSLKRLDSVLLDESRLKVEVLASGLEVPWDLEMDDTGFLWVAEQKGKVSRVNPETGAQQNLLQLSDVWQERTSGLLGMAVHKDFKKFPYVYLNYTARSDSGIISRLVRYTYESDSLVQPFPLLEIEGGTSHNGSRLAFGPDGKLYWATGDVHDFTYAQDARILNGKILRMNEDGSIPEDNPDPESYVWALGFRNMQGLAFSSKGFLYTSEHGDAIEDEVNLIQKGGNYGWPHIEGKHDLENERDFAENNNTLEPLRSWTPVIAPSGITYYGSSAIPEWRNSLLLTTLKGKSLRILFLNGTGDEITGEEILFENHYGRLRDVVSGAHGEIYLSTSNLDWNPQPGFPLDGDDKVLKISPANEVSSTPLIPVNAQQALAQNGKDLYLSYCASCHKEDGAGVRDVFPSLKASGLINGDPAKLIDVVLKGSGRSESGQQMPSFAFLSDSEVAEILNYIRDEWASSPTSISHDLIKQSR